MKQNNQIKKVNVRWLTMTAMLSAIASVLMYLEFSVPFIPSFVKMDLSELPALIAAFTMGPLSGVVVCLIKNIIHLPFSSSGCIGEISNFILGSAFVIPAGLIYKKFKSRKGALVGSFVGAAFMAVLSVFSNYFVVYPIYEKFMPIDAIIGMYQEINPNVNGLLDCLIIFNMPFTFIKGMISFGITFVIYKYISPLIKGKNNG